MLKKTITYKDLDGNDVTEDFYFNLNTAEVAEMELSYEGGLSEQLKRMITPPVNGGEIMATFKSIIMSSVGKRSDDGKQFIKNQDIRDAFFQSNAYSVMFMELVTDADAGAKFIRGIVPPDMAAAIAAGDRVTDIPLPDQTEEPAWLREGRTPTPDEIKNATPAQLQEAFRRQSQQ